MLRIKHEKRVLVAVDGLVADVVLVVADPHLKKRNHHQRPMKTSVMNQKVERNQYQHVEELHEAEAVKQKIRKSPKYPKKMTKNWQNQKATKARFVNMRFLIHHSLMEMIKNNEISIDWILK